jgi:hypothetical protein
MASNHAALARLRYLMVILLSVIVIWNVSNAGDLCRLAAVHQAERPVVSR